jgi:hypothetical protein
MRETKQLFKLCPSCNKEWLTREEFMRDPGLELNGYKADFESLEYGMFFFTHSVSNCCSTMVLLVNDFRSLYGGPVYPDRLALSEDCPRYCIDEKQMARCDALCECAFVREIMQIIRQEKKPQPA